MVDGVAPVQQTKNMFYFFKDKLLPKKYSLILVAVFIQIPPQCRWQELKDLVRQTALHIRQAVVYDDCHGHPTGLGQIIVKNEDEAWRTYNRLSTNGWNGNTLTVTLSLASAPTKPLAGPTKSPHMGRVPYSPGYSSPPRCPPLVSSPTGTMPPE
ncbi:Myelin expression factor 2 [Onygenales sp. PD_10]|nr:Myelin expression factor 2 [Onygenales sp. PD_10]